MIMQCQTCGIAFDDEFRTTICPHGTFAANDGANNFAHDTTSYLGPVEGARETVHTYTQSAADPAWQDDTRGGKVLVKNWWPPCGCGDPTCIYGNNCAYQPKAK